MKPFAPQKANIDTAAAVSRAGDATQRHRSISLIQRVQHNKGRPGAAFIALCRLIKFSCSLSVQVLFKVAAYPYTLLHDEEGVGV